MWSTTQQTATKYSTILLRKVSAQEVEPTDQFHRKSMAFPSLHRRTAATA
jgi:hypothetical protein